MDSYNIHLGPLVPALPGQGGPYTRYGSGRLVFSPLQKNHQVLREDERTT
jgi:hypothetical protein